MLMLRIHLIQNLYDLSDEGTRNEIVDSRAFSDYCEVESSNQIPDGDTIGRFRNLLIKNHIHEQFFALVVKTLTERGLILKKGTIVDSTIISAPSSTKNKDKQRDPDAHSVKKGMLDISDTKLMWRRQGFGACAHGGDHGGERA